MVVVLNFKVEVRTIRIFFFWYEMLFDKYLNLK